MKNKLIIAAGALFFGLLLFRWGAANPTEKSESGKLSFSIRFKDEVNPYNTSAVFVLPKEIISFEVIYPNADKTFSLEAPKGEILQTEPCCRWTWRAPSKPGSYTLRVNNTTDNETMTLNVFVMVPYEKVKRGKLNGYNIGSYPPSARMKSLYYEHPRGFVEVTAANRDTLVSPHFKLGQFLCKQSGGYPKYLVLRERLLYQLENVLARANDYGLQCQTLTIMSGYRTPYYNKLIRNVAYSRHLWGDAADIYIDSIPAKGAMKDLNRDGKVDVKDGLVLRNIIQDMVRDPMYSQFTGGLGAYRTAENHGPFVHLDVRGVPANW